MPTTYPHILPDWRLLGSPLFKEKKKKKRGCTLAGAWDRAVFGCFFFLFFCSSFCSNPLVAQLQYLPIDSSLTDG